MAARHCGPDLQQPPAHTAQQPAPVEFIEIAPGGHVRDIEPLTNVGDRDRPLGHHDLNNLALALNRIHSLFPYTENVFVCVYILHEKCLNVNRFVPLKHSM
jgi:hypothetical protein